MERDEAELRGRIEFRAGLAIAATIAMVALSPLNTWATAEPGLSGWGPAVVGVPVLLALIATFGLTGWWIDAVRSWWGPHRWFHRRRSLGSWLIPFVNLAAPPGEAGLLFESAGRPASWSRWWTRVWLLVVLVSVVPIESGPWVSSLGFLVIGGLVLWLVVSSMRSLRAEWARRDAEADATAASPID